MTHFPWPPTNPWEVHFATARWPVAAERVFLADAVRRIGRAMFIEWNDETAGWLQGGEQPFIPKVDFVFTPAGVDQRLYHLYHGAVRKVMSVGFYQHLQLLKAPMEEWLASMVPDPDGGEPLTSAQLRSQCGDDHEDEITREHWDSAWWHAMVRQDEVDGARRYLPPIAAAILSAAQAGKLKTFARPFNGGHAVELDAGAWDIDTAMDRVSWCALDPYRPHDPDAPLTHWLFVDGASLDAMLSKVEQTSFLDELRPKPAGHIIIEGLVDDASGNVVHLRAPSKAAAVTECTEWLVQRFDDPTTERMVKDQFKDEAVQRWQGRLSARGFVTSWTNAVAQRPERGKPGRRL